MSFLFIMFFLTSLYLFFFFNDTATTEIYTLSLHDALPISRCSPSPDLPDWTRSRPSRERRARSEEHTSELQSRQYLVCRLLLEKKKKKRRRNKVVAHRATKMLIAVDS